MVLNLNYKYPPKDLSKVVEYISVSLIQDASSLEKKIFTAIDSPFQIPRQTSPYLGIILKEKEFDFANVQLILCVIFTMLHDLSKTTEVYVPSKNLPRCPKIVFDAHR